MVSKTPLSCGQQVTTWLQDIPLVDDADRHHASDPPAIRVGSSQPEMQRPAPFGRLMAANLVAHHVECRNGVGIVSPFPRHGEGIARTPPGGQADR